MEEGTELQSGSGEGAWKMEFFCLPNLEKLFFSKKEKKKGEPCRTVELLLLHFPVSLPIPSESHGMDQILKEKTYLRIQNVHMS